MKPRGLVSPQGESSMIRRITRPLAFALLTAFLALPLAAQPSPEPRASSAFARIWERLAAPVLSLFTSEDTDGRGVWDPDGFTVPVPEETESDGRSIWDPNG
jgi:hypothetical protein